MGTTEYRGKIKASQGGIKVLVLHVKSMCMIMIDLSESTRSLVIKDENQGSALKSPCVRMYVQCSKLMCSVRGRSGASRSVFRKGDVQAVAGAVFVASSYESRIR